jgi:nicotinamidase-related amidase
MDKALVVPSRTALVNVDLQRGFVEGAADGLSIVERVNALAAICRRAGVMVIHTRHVLRSDGSNLGVLADIPKIRQGFLNEGSPSAEFHPDLVVELGDVCLEKPRFGAFYGTDLELILRSGGIDTIMISGISTPVCCDTTAREANARDFRVLFLRDATASTGDEAERFQETTIEILDGLFARIVTITEVVDALSEIPA